MIKKFCLIFLSLIFLTGCGTRHEDTLQFATWGSQSEIEILKPILKDFENQNPDIKVELIHIPQNYFQKLHLLLASNLAPDVIFINNLNIPVYEKFLLDLTPFVQNTYDYFPQVLDTMTYQGKLLAVPRDISTLVIFYNKDIFDKFNVPYPKPDWTIEEFLKTAQLLTRDDIFGISFEENSLFYLPYLRVMGEGFLSKDLIKIIDTPDSKKGIEFYSNLRKKYNVAPKKYQSASATMAQMFLNEKLAMQLSGRWLVPKYRESAEFDWDVINFPNYKGKSAVTLDSSGYAIIKSTDKQEQSLRLVKFLSTYDSVEKLTKTGLIVPARIDNINSEIFLDGKKPQNSKIFIDIIKNSEKTPVNKDYKEFTDKIDEKLNYSFN